MKTITLAVAAAVFSFGIGQAQPRCPSPATFDVLQAQLASGPCEVGNNAIVLYGPTTFKASVMPISQTHPNIKPSDITVAWNVNLTNPITVQAEFQCAVCQVAGQQDIHYELGFFYTGTLNNPGISLFPNVNGAAAGQGTQAEACLPYVSGLTTFLAGANAPFVQVTQGASISQQRTQLSGTLVVTGPEPVVLELKQSNNACTYALNQSPEIEFSAPLGN